MKLSKVLLFSIIPILAVGVIYSICLIIVINSTIKISLNNVKDDKGYYLDIQHESDPLVVDISQYRDMYSSLKSNTLYTYYELYEQPLEFPDAADGELTDCMQISENVQKDFQLSVTEGRLLEASDFVYDGESSLPVLMGNDYKSQYQLGDVFNVDYLFDEYAFTVIGFLSPGCSVSTSISYTPLDRMIVMPSFDAEASVPVTDGLLFHYASKTSGKIKMAVEDEAAVLSYIVPILEHAPSGQYSWNSSNFAAAFREHFGVALPTARVLLYVVAGCLAIAAAWCLWKLRRILWESNSVKTVIAKLLTCVAATDILYGIIALAAPELLQISFRYFIVNCFPVVLAVNCAMAAVVLVSVPIRR